MSELPSRINAVDSGELSQKPASLPSRIKLLDFGVNESTEGPVIVNQLTLDVFAVNQRQFGLEEIPLDFEHNTVPGTPENEKTQEPRNIAAMGCPVLNRTGLFLENLRWTPLGSQFASSYADISPAPILNGNVFIALHSAALTRTGAVYGLANPAALSASIGRCGDVKILAFSADVSRIEAMAPGRDRDEAILSMRARLKQFAVSADFARAFRERRLTK